MIIFELVIRIGNLIDLISPAIPTDETEASAVIDELRNLEPITFGLLNTGSVLSTPIISTSGLLTSDLAKKLCVRPIWRIALPALPVRTAAIRINARLRFNPARARQSAIAR